MLLAFSLALPVHACEELIGGAIYLAVEGCAKGCIRCCSDYDFDKTHGHLIIGRCVESRTLEELLSESNLRRVKTITIKEGVTKIGKDAFINCENLENVEIPDSVTEIGRSAFKGCTGLTSITIPDRVTSIGGQAFKGCTGLTSITIPDSVTSIGRSAFAGCTSLKEVTIPRELDITFSEHVKVNRI